jgi:hypothetical protein
LPFCALAFSEEGSVQEKEAYNEEKQEHSQALDLGDLVLESQIGHLHHTFFPEVVYISPTKLFSTLQERIAQGEIMMFQRIPKSIWFGTLFSTIVLGIVPGIAFPQNTISLAIPLIIGWLYLPLSLFGSSVDYLTHVPEWLVLLTRLYYPLTALVMAACVIWTVRSTGKKLDALLMAGLLACGSTVVCMLVGLVAPSLNSNGTYYSVGPVVPILLNLLFSAVLGWGAGCLILRLRRGMASKGKSPQAQQL